MVPLVAVLRPEATKPPVCQAVAVAFTPFWFPGWIGSLCQALCEGPFHGLPTPTLYGGVWPPLPTVGSSACLGSEPRAPVSASGVPLTPPQPSPAQFHLDPAPGWQVRSSHLGILPSEGV